MKFRALVVVVVLVVTSGGVAHAQPGTVFVEGQGGVMIPVGDFSHDQNIGGAYSIAAGYEMLEFLDLMLQFTHSFNDNDNDRDRFSGPGFSGFSNETNQTFVVGVGPRVNFLPSDFNVRPYGVFQVGWYHFAYFNEVTTDFGTLVSSDDHDSVGLRAGLGIEGTVFSLYERRDDRYPLMEVTVGINGNYHQAFDPSRPDKQFVTTMGSVGVRF
jgi:hypothetical protein